MWLGSKVYDVIAGSKRVVPSSHFIDRDEALFRFPTLKAEGLKVRDDDESPSEIRLNNADIWSDGRRDRAPSFTMTACTMIRA